MNRVGAMGGGAYRGGVTYTGGGANELPPPASGLLWGAGLMNEAVLIKGAGL